MKYKYEFEMPETPYESNCRVCPFCDITLGWVSCFFQEDFDFNIIEKTEKQTTELYAEMDMNCPLEVVK